MTTIMATIMTTIMTTTMTNLLRNANSKWRVVAGKTRIGKGTRNLLGKLSRSGNGTVRQVEWW